MAANKVLISVIVPVYKVELYLPKCIESIINQTYKKLDIILVDDGSPDACGKICDKYASLDSRIRVIHTENGGVCTGFFRKKPEEVNKGQRMEYIALQSGEKSWTTVAICRVIQCDGSEFFELRMPERYMKI